MATAVLLAKPVVGPFLYTFTFRLPFVLGITEPPDHEVGLPSDYASEHDIEVFQRPPFVRLRFFNAPISDYKFWPLNMPVAVEYFYRGDIGNRDELGGHLYEQWISAETPAAFLEGESQTDPAYAFHRSYFTLNLFLQAFAIARGSDWVRPVSVRELRPIVTIGRRDMNGHWEYLSPMLMMPDAKARKLSSRPLEEHLQELNQAMQAILVGEPFIRSRQWRARAERRKYEGDAADSIVSFQIAAENLAYELWGLLLVDEGLTSQEIQALQSGDLPYKSLLTKELPSRLGGSWDLTRGNTPVGRYWRDLYGLRNRIVHAGYLAHDGDAARAETAFAAFDEYLDMRLKVIRKRYPRSLLAKVSRKELEERGWVTKSLRTLIDQLEAEPSPFYLPRDIAAR